MSKIANVKWIEMVEFQFHRENIHVQWCYLYSEKAKRQRVSNNTCEWANSCGNESMRMRFSVTLSVYYDIECEEMKAIAMLLPEF